MLQIMSAKSEDMSTYGENDRGKLEVTPASHIPALESLALAAPFRA